MKKKLIITLSVLLGLVAIALTLCFTVFTIKDIQIDFRTSTTKEWKNEELIQDAEIPKGKCLLFLSKQKFVDKLEKENPYLEVINIETTFPSTIIIHCAERQEMYAIKKEEKTFFCDKDLKIVRIGYGTYDSTKENAILLKGIELDKEYEEGDFIETDLSELKRLKSSMEENSKTLPQILGFCKEINIEKKKNDLSGKEEVNLTIKTFADREITILNIESNLTKKLQRMFQALPELYELLVENGDYTSEEVDRCSLVIGNQITNEDELYVHIYLDGSVVESREKE